MPPLSHSHARGPVEIPRNTAGTVWVTPVHSAYTASVLYVVYVAGQPSRREQLIARNVGVDLPNRVGHIIASVISSRRSRHLGVGLQPPVRKPKLTATTGLAKSNECSDIILPIEIETNVLRDVLEYAILIRGRRANLPNERE